MLSPAAIRIVLTSSFEPGKGIKPGGVLPIHSMAIAPVGELKEYAVTSGHIVVAEAPRQPIQ